MGVVVTNTGIPTEIFPAENGNREYDRENTPTDSVPVSAGFPVFSRLPVFTAGAVYNRFRR